MYRIAIEFYCPDAENNKHIFQTLLLNKMHCSDHTFQAVGGSWRSNSVPQERAMQHFGIWLESSELEIKRKPLLSRACAMDPTRISWLPQVTCGKPGSGTMLEEEPVFRKRRHTRPRGIRSSQALHAYYPNLLFAWPAIFPRCKLQLADPPMRNRSLLSWYRQ